MHWMPISGQLISIPTTFISRPGCNYSITMANLPACQINTVFPGLKMFILNTIKPLELAHLLAHSGA